MFTILRALLKWFKGELGELNPGLRIMLYIEIAFYFVAGFVLFIWQPEFLTE